MHTTDLLARIERLERRVLALEGKVYHAGALARGVREVVAKWPGPFTALQIRDAVYELQPELKPITEQHQVTTILHRMEKAGEIICTFRGAGPTPNIFERASCPPERAGKAGARFGAKHEGESGFRGIVRSALEDLPEHFTLADLRKWAAEKAPDARIPQGSWSSTLYKMQQQKELVVVKNGGRATGLKIYGRGPRRITPTGAELRDLEESWREFRRGITVPESELLTNLERGRTE